MAIDSTPSTVATNALAAIPFETLIGGPLDACIKAQAAAAQTTWKFIQEVGLNVDPVTKKKSAVNVSFQFLQNGKMAQLNVPLLTIVPIPYLAIYSLDINFKANISASSSSVNEDTKSETIGGEASVGFSGWGLKAEVKANYSSKKDSKATQESKYSVEYTMDIAIKAGQDSMPAGLAKVLELLGNSLDVSNPKGELNVNSSFLNLDNGEAKLVVTYKNSDGAFEPDKIEIDGVTGETDDTNKVYILTEAKEYIVKVGADKQIKVKVA